MMKKYKVFCILFLVMFLTGCDTKDNDTIYYNLNIGTSLKEKLEVYLPKNAYEIAKENQEEEESYTKIEYTLLKENIEPIFSLEDVYYNKEINKNFNNIKVTLQYDYIESDFLESKYIMNCFENYDIVSYEDKLSINLSGQFYCLNDKDNLEIKVNSIFNIESSNGRLEDNSYVWNINKDNVNNVNISHVVLRNYDGMVKDREELLPVKSNNVFSKIKLVVLVIMLLFIIILVRKKKIDL